MVVVGGGGGWWFEGNFSVLLLSKTKVLFFELDLDQAEQFFTTLEASELSRDMAKITGTLILAVLYEI